MSNWTLYQSISFLCQITKQLQDIYDVETMVPSWTLSFLQLKVGTYSLYLVSRVVIIFVSMWTIRVSGESNVHLCPLGVIRWSKKGKKLSV